MIVESYQSLRCCLDAAVFCGCETSFACCCSCENNSKGEFGRGH